MNSLSSSTSPKIATAADLERLLTRAVVLPGLTAETGAEVAFTIRRIHRREYLLCYPPLPASVLDGPLDELEIRERAWLESITPEALAARSHAAVQATFRIVQVALVDPPGLTLAQLAALGDDADVLATAVLQFSRLIPETTPNGGPPAAAASDAADAA